MRIFRLIPIFLLVLLFSCREEAGKRTEQRSDTYKEEIRQAEKDFEKMAEEKGIAEAFAFFADSNAVISRGNDSIITGKEAIRNFYSSAFYQTAKVKWAPDYIDVSDDGTMGWTYGRYVWNNTDSTGKPMELRGVFHTVWKRQKDGTWRWVWD
jgi:ketosteroid isomerase-like protein